jgi:hypothetical protein
VETRWYYRGAHAEDACACRRSRCLRRSTHSPMPPGVNSFARSSGAHAGAHILEAHMPGARTVHSLLHTCPLNCLSPQFSSHDSYSGLPTSCGTPSLVSGSPVVFGGKPLEYLSLFKIRKLCFYKAHSFIRIPRGLILS